MKVLIFINCMEGGGAERVTANLANFWADRGWDVTIVTIASVELDFYSLHPKVKRISLGLANDSGNTLTGLGQNIRRIGALRQLLKELRPDIAISIMSTANVVLALAGYGIPYVKKIGTEHIHPPQIPLRGIWEILRSYTYGCLDAVTALTGKSRDWIKTHTRAKSIAVIPNALSWPLLPQEPVIDPAKYCKPARRIVLGVGRLEVQKGFDWLIEVFARLSDKHTEWDLVILGEGRRRLELEGQIKKSGLPDRVFMPGLAGNLGEWYSRADLYVMSSRFEGFGNTIVEAMAHKIAVISFDCDCGPGDIIRHEVDGLLVAPADLSGLAAAMDRLMSDPSARERLGKKGLEAKERFSKEKIMGIWDELINRISGR